MSTQFPNAGGQGPVLSDNMPKLSGGLSRGVNKTAIVYIAVVSIAAIGMTMWVASSAFSADEKEKRAVIYEEVSVPDKPVLNLSPPEPLTVSKADAPLLPDDMPQMEAKKERDDLMQRRIESESDIVSNKDVEKGQTWFSDKFSSVERGGVSVLANADFTLAKGTFIRCTLETRIVSTLAGNTSCIVTEPIYSVNGSHLLIDRGSKIVGNYQYADEHFDRIGVIWSRVLTTTGLDVRIDSQGTDALGGAGVPGEYNGHWGERIGAAMLVSLLADGIDVGAQRYANEHNMQGPTNYNPYGHVVGVDPWDSATVATAKKAASDILEKSANRKATVTVLNGTVVNIFATRDVDFSTVMR